MAKKPTSKKTKTIRKIKGALDPKKPSTKKIKKKPKALGGIIC